MSVGIAPVGVVSLGIVSTYGRGTCRRGVCGRGVYGLGYVGVVYEALGSNTHPNAKLSGTYIHVYDILKDRIDIVTKATGCNCI